MLCHGVDVKLNLTVKLRYESTVNRVLSWLAEKTLVNHYFKCVSLEEVKELFGSAASHHLLLSPDLLTLVSTLLEITAF